MGRHMEGAVVQACRELAYWDLLLVQLGPYPKLPYLALVKKRKHYQYQDLTFLVKVA